MVGAGHLQALLERGVEAGTVADDDGGGDGGCRGIVRPHVREESVANECPHVGRTLLPPRAMGRDVDQAPALDASHQRQAAPGQRETVVGHSGIEVVRRPAKGRRGVDDAAGPPLPHLWLGQCAADRQRDRLPAVHVDVGDPENGQPEPHAVGASRSILFNKAVQPSHTVGPDPLQQCRKVWILCAPVRVAPKRQPSAANSRQRHSEHDGCAAVPEGERRSTRAAHEPHERRAGIDRSRERDQDARTKREGEGDGKEGHAGPIAKGGPTCSHQMCRSAEVPEC